MVDPTHDGKKTRRITPVVWIVLIMLAATAIACACGGLQGQVERALEEAASEVTVEVPTIEIPEVEIEEPTEESNGEAAPVEEEPAIEEPTEVPIEEPTEEVAAGGGTCDPRSSAIQVDTSVAGHIDATDEGYPANCTHYCMWLPESANGLDVTLSGFSGDLDLYVVYGEFDEILNPDPESATWVSNDTGTTEEAVSVSSPGTDSAFYIEVCSYEGTASDFTLTTATR